MKRYIPTKEELIQDAKLLQELPVSKVRCDTCGYRIVWHTNEDQKKVIGCQCSVDPNWYNMALDHLTYRDFVLAYKNVFQDLFSEYVLQRLVDELMARQLNNKLREQSSKK